MSFIPDEAGSQNYWFVGAHWNNKDQTSRFISEGLWENGYENKYLELVKSIQPGDRIAIKSTYIRKNNLPFDNRGFKVSVMAIKAIGTVTENLGDGQKVRVDWIPLNPMREWYFFTYLKTIWHVVPGNWATDALIGFAFYDKSQDLRQFRNHPFWRERFGDIPVEMRKFRWTRFYEAVAEKLLQFQNNRSALVAGIYDIAGRVDGLANLQDQYIDGTPGPLKDICPFTAIAIFNRGITDINRKTIAIELAKFLGVEESVPESFEGIPVVNNQRSWFFQYEKDRQPEDIGTLWEVFEKALEFVESDDNEVRSDFIRTFNNATNIKGIGWNLTMGLYWIRPWVYPTLDSKSRLYIENKLKIQIPRNGPKGRCDAINYLNLIDTMEARFLKEEYQFHSFPELSLAAWIDKDIEPHQTASYTLDDIIAEGCFIERGELENIFERLKTKMNLILQGPPGTGKTWLAKRLAFALIGHRDNRFVRALQFHPNLSYEDFVRGWRPVGEGKLSLVDGPFMEIVKAALEKPTMPHVIVIEEINRGNPAQIFGEILTLLEADKRTPADALELCYRRAGDERVFIPDNLFVIGTMNIADRSLALVDLALRRRFAFVDLAPRFGKVWHDWVSSKFGLDSEILSEIEKRILALNETITADSSLGPQFRIGHSFVTPHSRISNLDTREWFKQVVESEIGPQLDEYWFDSRDNARNARLRLTEGF